MICGHANGSYKAGGWRSGVILRRVIPRSDGGLSSLGVRYDLFGYR